MREPFFTNRQDIAGELEALLKSELSLYLYQPDRNHQPLQIKSINLQHQPPLVVFFKSQPFRTAEKSCCVLYKPEGRMPHCFDSVVFEESDHHLDIVIPKEISVIQRRRHQRLQTPPPSRAAFTHKEGRRLHSAVVLDISAAGARLAGRLSPKIGTGFLLGPLSFTLHLQFASEVVRFNVAEAEVARAVREDGVVREAGIRFELEAAEKSLLERYMEMRAIEIVGAAQAAHPSPT